MKHPKHFPLIAIVIAAICLITSMSIYAGDKTFTTVRVQDYQISDSTIMHLFYKDIVPFLEKYDVSPNDWYLGIWLNDTDFISEGTKLTFFIDAKKILTITDINLAHGLYPYNKFWIFLYGPIDSTELPTTQILRVKKKLYDDNELPVINESCIWWIYEKAPGEEWHYVESSLDWTSERFLKSIFKK